MLDNTVFILQLNGKPLLASSRISTIYELGFAVLEINDVTVFDHGIYEGGALFLFFASKKAFL